MTTYDYLHFTSALILYICIIPLKGFQNPAFKQISWSWV